MLDRVITEFHDAFVLLRLVFSAYCEEGMELGRVIIVACACSAVTCI